MKTALAIILGLMFAVALAVYLLLGGDRGTSPASTAPIPATLAPAKAPVDEKVDRAAIHDLIRRTQDANNAGDPDAWLDCFAADAVYMPPGSPAVSDPAGMRAIAEAGFSGSTVDITLTPVEIEIHGDWAFARLQVQGSGTLVTGDAPFPIDMKEIILLERQSDGAWKIARLIANRNSHG